MFNSNVRGFDMGTRRRCKTWRLYLGGKLHIRDVLEWALGANMTLEAAKKHLLEYYRDLNPELKLM
jgi:hypothetical protein